MTLVSCRNFLGKKLLILKYPHILKINFWEKFSKNQGIYN